MARIIISKYWVYSAVLIVGTIAGSIIGYVAWQLVRYGLGWA